MKVGGVVHDNVVHAKKHVKVNGKFIGKAPSYLRSRTIESLGERRLSKQKRAPRLWTGRGAYGGPYRAQPALQSRQPPHA